MFNVFTKALTWGLALFLTQRMVLTATLKEVLYLNFMNGSSSKKAGSTAVLGTNVLQTPYSSVEMQTLNRFYYRVHQPILIVLLWQV